MDYYELARGPLVGIAFAVFFFGCVCRVLFTLIKKQHRKMLYPSATVKGGIRSIIYGILPFGSSYMRANPVLAIVTILFHVCLLLLPLFLLAHILLWYESFNILWWNIPELVSDIMTVIVVLSCLFFCGRRVFIPEVKHVTSAGDFVLLILIMFPFLTGFLATHQWGPYRPLLIAHIVSGELLLMVIPFSRLGHMLFFWLSRAYLGSEYSKVLKAGDW